MLSSIANSCCTFVEFQKEKDSTDLNDVELTDRLQPGEEQTVRLKFSPNSIFYVEGINEDEIELVVYFIGSLER